MTFQQLRKGKKWLKLLCREFSQRGQTHIVTMFQYASLERHEYGEHEDRSAGETIVLRVRDREWKTMGRLSRWEVEKCLMAIATIEGVYDSSIVPYPPDEEPTSPRMSDGEVGLNNCFFKTERTIGHDELRFRSEAEVAVYDELKRRKLLFFPNAAAVFGDAKVKKEPDFLICLNGKWGILEVMGKEHHNETTAVKDHERTRLFKKHGIKCIEFFSGARCLFNPSAVVDEFLELLANY